MLATASSQIPTPTQPVEKPAAQSPTSSFSPDTKYCAICTSLGKICPNEFPVSLDWNEGLRAEDRKDQDKGEDNLSVCLDWDADLEEQERKNQEIENLKGQQ